MLGMSETTDRLDRIEASLTAIVAGLDRLEAAVEAAVGLLNPAAKFKLAAAGFASRFTKGPGEHGDSQDISYRPDA